MNILDLMDKYLKPIAILDFLDNEIHSQSDQRKQYGEVPLKFEQFKYQTITSHWHFDCMYQYDGHVIIYHYENTPIQIYRKFLLQQLKIFR